MDNYVIFWNKERRERMNTLYQQAENKETPFMLATKRLIDRLAAYDMDRMRRDAYDYR